MARVGFALGFRTLGLFRRRPSLLPLLLVTLLELLSLLLMLTFHRIQGLTIVGS